MSREKSFNILTGPGLPALLVVLFVGLKLTGYISWSWLWVLSPIWISWAVAIIVIGLFLVFALIVAILSA